MKRIIQLIKTIFKWIFTHKKIIFLYIPLACTILLSIYVTVIYFNWQNDKEKAFIKLGKYKRLIDRTEELKKGFVYSYNDIDLSAKVVDIPTRIYGKNNELIGELFEQKREIVPYDFIPETLVNGVIASEDREFYKHHGVSYKGIFRAFIKNVLNLGIVQGGSTITQQLAKVLFTDMERSLKRKIFEAFCALDIEKLYDKQDILSMYLNLIYFGSGAYGVESTSNMYFGRPVKTLNDVECAMIVATISSPRIYSPIINLNNSIRKTRRILKSLVDSGFSKKKRVEYQYKKFLKKWDVVFDKNGKAVSSLIGSFAYSSYRINRAPFFNERIRRVLVKRFGDKVVKKGGLSVYTTIDAALQDVALLSLRKGIRNQRNYHIKLAGKMRNRKKAVIEKGKAENIEGALVSINPFTGELLAYVGGSDFSVSNQNDHVSQIFRQPGSSIKPIVYTAALENRDITPSTIFVDEKTVFKGGYSPGNYSHKYEGKMTVREALRKSVNVIAVKILDKTGYDKPFEYLRKSLNLDENDFNKRFGRTLSFTLGTYEISPLENSVLHSVIVNGGDYLRPYGIKYVKDYNGNIVWNNEEEVREDVVEKRKKIGKIIDPLAASITVSMLKNPYYYAVRRMNIKFEVAAKTGTSTKHVDAWCVGYSRDLVTVVWIGNKKGAISLGRGRGGSAVSVPVWAEFISKIYKENKPGDFPVPDEGLSTEKICVDSGEVAGRNGECPETVNQLYYSGSEPGKFCHIHVINENTGKIAKD